MSSTPHSNVSYSHQDIQEALKFAFLSYYSNRHTREFPDDILKTTVKRCCYDQFKSNQKILRDMGVTPEMLNDPGLNKSSPAIKPSARGLGNIHEPNFVLPAPLSFLLTATQCHAEKHGSFLINGVPIPPVWNH